MKRLLSVALVFFISTLIAAAQTATVSLVGTVNGPDGAIPGATIVVRDNQTNKELTDVSSSEGTFRFPNLQSGFYTVTVTSQGFKTFIANDVKVETGKDFSLPVNLEVGDVSAQVEVTVGEDLINSTDAEINGNVSRVQLDQLPSLGRNPLNFVPLQPGAASNGNQNTVINGIRTSGTQTTIDGVNVQDNFIRSNATDFSPARPSVEEVEEFAVGAQGNAEDGFGGARIQFVTRRGTNSFRGRLFEFNRNSALSARRFFNAVDPFRNRNQFGGNLGGPIVKDKLFFFGAYEKIIDRQSAPAQFSTVLTENARNGIFTYNAATTAGGVTAGQLVTVNLFDAARLAAANANAGAGRGTTPGIAGINSVIQQRFLSALPAGNSTQVGDQRNTTGFLVNQQDNFEQTNYTTRIDFNPNDKSIITGTFRFVRQVDQRADVDNSFNIVPLVDQPSINPAFSAGWVFTPSSNFSNDLRGGFFFSEPIFLRTDGGGQTNFVAPTLITNPEVTFQNQGRKADTYSLQDNATYIYKNHSFAFGGQFQAVRLDTFNDAGIVSTFNLGTNVNTPQFSPGNFTSNTLFPGGVPQAQRAGANNLLALLGGIVSSASQTQNVETLTSGFIPGATNRARFDYDIYSFYFSDRWTIRPDLTINLGLRYDRFTALRNPDGLGLEPVISDPDNIRASLLNPAGSFQNLGTNIGKPGQYYNSDKDNFGPNVSIAYSPDFSGGFGRSLFGDKGKTVIRAGYRISYINDENVTAPNNAISGNQGLSLTSSVFNSVTNTTQLNARVDALPTIPTLAFQDNRTFAQNNQLAGLFGTAFAVDPNLKTPLYQEYNFGIQREVGFDTAVEVRYVGTRSNNLLRGLDFNQVDIFNNGFLNDFNRARSNFVLTGNAACTTAQNAGCQTLTVFPNLASGGLLTNAAVTNQLVAGTSADLAILYVTNGLTGSVPFLPNANIGVADLLGNFAESDYNGLQVEVRRRLNQGLALSANYTFSKALTNAQGTGQTRFEPNLDNAQPELERSRADFDQTHVFNVLATYELPFGRGRQFFNQGGIANFLLGDFQVGAIVRIASGSPITITDSRGTLNRAGRSGRQTALTNLSERELRDLVGVYKTANGVFYLNPTALGRNPDGSLAAGRTGQGAEGFGTTPFEGQVFFNNVPGQTSGLSRAIFTGPTRYNLDLTISKRFTFGERYSFQIQGDLFNAFNRANFIQNQFLAAPNNTEDVSNVNFGRITSTFDPRIVQVAGRFFF